MKCYIRFWKKKIVTTICKYFSISSSLHNMQMQLKKLVITKCDLYTFLNTQGIQYFWSLPVLHYLQAVPFIDIWTIFINILYNTDFKIRRYQTILGR
jgi:hypothetical protein